MHKFEVKNIERLLSVDRLGGRPPEELLTDSGLAGGMVFADIGCGPGYFTLPAASVVGPGGKVYAVDLQQEMLLELKKRGLPQNVVSLRSKENSIPVEDAVVDFTLLAYVLHEARDRPLFLTEIRRISKNRGRVLVLDWEKREEEAGPPFSDRVSMEEALELLTAEGFTVIEKGPLTPSHWRILAERR